MSTDQELFEAWFRVADADRDGAVGGVEAVAFFGRSGLPQATLFQVCCVYCVCVCVCVVRGR
jgi:hypothetical protein